ncbi:hypothetical protein THIOKS11010004 [Thiocapsa sp. KS1]|nr:hypothetical protein THIOKS11010004 [Thiocapsa sp. KS1]
MAAPATAGRTPNPAGRIRRKIAREAEGLADTMIRMAKLGDVVALAWCLDRVVPPAQPTPQKSPDPATEA